MYLFLFHVQEQERTMVQGRGEQAGNKVEELCKSVNDLEGR